MSHGSIGALVSLMPSSVGVEIRGLFTDFWLHARFGIGVLVCGSGRVTLSGRRGCLQTFFCNMSGFSAEKAEVLVETVLLLLLSEFAVFLSLEERSELGFF